MNKKVTSLLEEIIQQNLMVIFLSLLKIVTLFISITELVIGLLLTSMIEVQLIYSMITQEEFQLLIQVVKF